MLSGWGPREGRAEPCLSFMPNPYSLLLQEAFSVSPGLPSQMHQGSPARQRTRPALGAQVRCVAGMRVQTEAVSDDRGRTPALTAFLE